MLNDFALSAPGIRARRISSERIKIEGVRNTTSSFAPDARDEQPAAAFESTVSLNDAAHGDSQGASQTGYVSRQRRNALQQLEDAELLTRFQAGDEAAFYTLFERRQKEIYTHCFRMCARDGEKANDAFQDTFIKVFTRKTLFTDAANGRAWLYRIATNTCLNALRYDKRHPNAAIDDRMASQDPALQPDFRTEQDSLKESLEQAMASLPIELREPFLLREIEEFSYEDAAEQLGITVAACRQKVYRAKQMLREALQEVVGGTMGKKRMSTEE
ncbi:MAG TPA: RNA polymerase sigma factor [Candidatus Kapabacteria bacterium]